MQPRDALTLVALAALWGASFLFMRLGARDFGAVALAALRVAIASAVLLPLLTARGEWPVLRRHWRAVLAVGVLSSALPFVLFGHAALTLGAGTMSIFNATTPLWGALVAWLWLRDALTPLRIAGLALGFAGVLGLAWSQAGAAAGASSANALAIAAALGATLSYGIAASATKRHLTGVAPVALAAGSQFAAAAVLAVPALLAWPTAAPASTAWAAVAGLGVLSTGLAYILFFQLIARVGPANAIAVTYLIPVFAMLWGWLLLGERVTAPMLAGAAVVLAGTALATGVVRGRQRDAARAT